MSHVDLGVVVCLFPLVIFFSNMPSYAGENSKRVRAREIGIEVGEMSTGAANAITDVEGVSVGHKTIFKGDSMRTGVTAILPHAGNIFQEKVPAVVYVGNGFGKLAGSTQVEELGNIETPIILTNTLSVGTALTATVRYTLGLSGNENVRSVNAVVGEVNDGYLNDIRGLHVTEADVLAAIKDAKPGPVEEGNVGAGTGAVAFRLKGGIGTASRLVPKEDSGFYTVGVLILSNYGGILEIIGAPVGRELKLLEQKRDTAQGEDGSCIIVVATDAPLCPRNLKRLAKRALHGLARTGSFMSNGSGDYVISFSTAYRIRHGSKKPVSLPALIPNETMTPFFHAVVGATQEAVYNSMFMATTTKGHQGHEIHAIPIDEVIKICEKYNVLHLKK